MKSWSAAIVLTLSVTTAFAAMPQCVVLEGQPDGDLNRTVAELGNYYQRMTGIKLTVIVRESQEVPASAAIYLGPAAVGGQGFTEKELADTGNYGGFRIREKNGNVYIAGKYCLAPYYGVYRYLELLGAEFYSRDHEVIPSDVKTNLPAGTDILDVPHYELRIVSNMYSKLGGMPYRKLAGKWGGHGSGWHSLPMLVKLSEYAETHPEYFALVNGKRVAADYKEGDRFSHFTQLCMSNPQVKKLVLRNAIQWVKDQPDRIGFSINPADGADWCECEGCVKMDHGDTRNKTDRVIAFANPIVDKLKEMFPEKDFQVMVYYNCLAPPKVEKLTPDATLLLCPYTPHVRDRGHWFDHPANAQFTEIYKYWTKHAGKKWVYEYPIALQGQGYTPLAFNNDHFNFRIKQYARDGYTGITCNGRVAYMHSLWVYVTNRLLWNPDQDERPLIERFMKGYYGPVAEDMLGIYDFLTAIARKPDRIQGVAAPYTQFVTVPEAEKLLKLFDAAEARAKDDEALLRKVTREKFPVLFTYLSIVNPMVGNIKDMKAYRARMTQFAQVYKTQKRYSFHYAMYLPPSWLKRYFNWTLHDLDRYYATPEQVVIPERIEAPKVVKIENGWEIPLTMLEGANYPRLYRWKCEPKVATFLYPRGTAGSARRFTFDIELPEALTGAKLSIVGLDDDKPGTTPFTITINSREIFNGKNGYDEHKWIAIDYPIPDGLLRKGRNTVVLYNLSEEPLSNRQWLGLHSIKLVVLE